jgi:hypothetical protein
VVAIYPASPKALNDVHIKDNNKILDIVLYVNFFLIDKFSKFDNIILGVKIPIIKNKMESKNFQIIVGKEDSIVKKNSIKILEDQCMYLNIKKFELLNLVNLLI